MSECRYVLAKSGASGIVELEDTLHGHIIYVGIEDIRYIGLTRSNLEELKEQLDKMLKKP